MTITSMEPRDYIPTNEDLVSWIDQQETDEKIAVGLIEEAAVILGGEVTHITCVNSKLNKCQKYVITYDVNS